MTAKRDQTAPTGIAALSGMPADWCRPLTKQAANRSAQRSTREMTAAVAAGDPAAFTELFHGWFDTMFREARNATGRDESFCLDVVQDSMMRVIRSMPEMETEGRLRNWLRVVVQSCAYDRLRKELRRQRWEREAVASRSDELEAIASDGAADEGTLQRIQWLRDQLMNLDEQNARMIVLRYRFGWTLERIGRAIGLRPGAVDGRLRRVVDGLRRRARESSDG